MASNKKQMNCWQDVKESTSIFGNWQLLTEWGKGFIHETATFLWATAQLYINYYTEVKQKQINYV